MSAEVWGVVAAFAGVSAAFLAVLVGAFFWLVSSIQKSSQDIRTEMRELRAELRSEIRLDGQERRTDMQRLLDAFYRHRHEGGGAIYVPESGD